jgi:hypothetical protein
VAAGRIIRGHNQPQVNIAKPPNAAVMEPVRQRTPPTLRPDKCQAAFITRRGGPESTGAKEQIVSKTVALSTAVAGLLVADAAQAAELDALVAKSIKLGDLVGIAYYTVEQTGYQVVATVSSGAKAPPVRFISTLLAGQKAVLSVPRDPGESALTLEVERSGDRVFVNASAPLTSISH